MDLHNRRVIPGLNDSHLHVIRAGLFYNLELGWDGVPTLSQALKQLKDQADRTPPPQWVRVVGGWNEFQFAEGRMPTLEEINVDGNIVYASDEFAKHDPALPPVSPDWSPVRHYGGYHNSHRINDADGNTQPGHKHLPGHSHWIMGADGRAWQTGCTCGV